MHQLLRLQVRLLVQLLVAAQAATDHLVRRRQGRGTGPGPRRCDEEGQATAEYALVLLAAAAVAGLLIAWAVNTGAVGRLLDAVFERLLAKGDPVR